MFKLCSFKKEKWFYLHVLIHNHTYTKYVYKLTELDQNTLESQRCGQIDLKSSMWARQNRRISIF